MSSSDESQDIYETPGTTPSFKTELAQQLSALIPEAIADGKVDVEKLKELLGDDVGDDRERFGLFWPGKKRALRAAQEPTSATLKPDFENSKDWDTTKNIFVEGDNLEVLKILQKHYHGKIKMIYIDPPYNTGKDFVYPDNFKEGLETYLEWTRQVNEEGKKVSTNSETEGRYHSNWLNMMYPRLKLARNLLTEDGLIFVSIDDNEVDNLKKLCNELFGESNYLNTIIWHYGKMSNEQNKLPNNHEYVLVYRKSLAAGIFEKVKKEDSEYRNRYLRFVTPDNKVLFGSVKNSTDNLVLGRVKKVKEELGKQELADDDVLFDFNREFKSHSDTIYVSTIKGNADENVKEFDTGQKPLALMDLLLQFGAPAKDSIVLDFFAGSGTTAHAVMQRNASDGGNRVYVLVQLPEPVADDSEAAKAGHKTVADITRARLKKAADRVGLGVDAGFRTYQLVDTSFSKWRVNSEVDATSLEQHLLDLRDSVNDDATPDALLTEILLKQGYSLAEQMGDAEVAGLKLKTVGEGLVFAYLDEHTKPTLGQLRDIVAKQPARFIILEDAFGGDDELKTNLAQECKSRGVELWTA